MKIPSLRAILAALVGFMTQSPMGEGCVVTYDEIEFRPNWPEDLRNGS